MAGKARKWEEAAIKRSYAPQNQISRVVVVRVEESTSQLLCVLVWVAFAWVKASKQKADMAPARICRSLDFNTQASDVSSCPFGTFPLGTCL